MARRWPCALLAAGWVFAGCVGLVSAEEGLAPQGAAVLQGLDKVTARITEIRAPIDQPVRFNALEITVRACKKAPPEEPPESAAYLEIREIRPNEQPIYLFAGWMFASSPAVSALEHPVYDVWVVDCLAPAAAPADQPSG